MAKVETTKNLIIDANAAARGASIQLSLAPGEVRFTVDNDGVAHLAHMDPQEATQFGVALIQLAAQAAALAQQRQLQIAQGLPPLPPMNGLPNG